MKERTQLSLIDKSRFKSDGGQWLTQSLFLEYQYQTDTACFTLTDDDKEYKGVVYPSIKKIYMEAADPTEYQFANSVLGGWDHWLKMIENKWILSHVKRWRDELEVSIRSSAILGIRDMVDNFQAQKYIADKGWDKNSVGRPKKDREDQFRDARIEDELRETVERMNKYEKAA